MLSRIFGLAVLGLCLAACNVGVAGDKDKVVKDVVKDKDVKKDVVKDKVVKKDAVKDKGKDKEKKAPPKIALKSVVGPVTGIDLAKGTFTVGQPDSKSRTFIVNDDTKFVGPKGGSRGMGKPGLKDETLVNGAAVRVAFGQDGQVALEVHLPARAVTALKPTPPEKIKVPEVKVPDVKTPAANVPPATPQAAPAPLAPPQYIPQVEWSEPRVGPIRRLFRRLFRGE
jgi:hypothetical protein